MEGAVGEEEGGEKRLRERDSEPTVDGGVTPAQTRSPNPHSKTLLIDILSNTVGENQLRVFGSFPPTFFFSLPLSSQLQLTLSSLFHACHSQPVCQLAVECKQGTLGMAAREEQRWRSQAGALLGDARFAAAAVARIASPRERPSPLLHSLQCMIGQLFRW